MSSQSRTAPLADDPVRTRERAGRILHDRRLLALLLAGGTMATIVVFVVGFSSAFFTASTTNKSTTASAGAITLSLNPSGQLLDGAALVPGAVRSATVTVTNTAQAASVTLAANGIVDTPSGGRSLADVLYVKISEIAPNPGVNLNAKLRVLTTPLELGTWRPAEQRTYRIELTWPASQTSLAYANVKTTFGFAWNARSTA